MHLRYFWLKICKLVGLAGFYPLHPKTFIRARHSREADEKLKQQRASVAAAGDASKPSQEAASPSSPAVAAAQADAWSDFSPEYYYLHRPRPYYYSDYLLGYSSTHAGPDWFCSVMMRNFVFWSLLVAVSVWTAREVRSQASVSCDAECSALLRPSGSDAAFSRANCSFHSDTPTCHNLSLKYSFNRPCTTAELDVLFSSWLWHQPLTNMWVGFFFWHIKC